METVLSDTIVPISSDIAIAIALWIWDIMPRFHTTIAIVTVTSLKIGYHCNFYVNRLGLFPPSESNSDSDVTFTKFGMGSVPIS